MEESDVNTLLTEHLRDTLSNPEKLQLVSTLRTDNNRLVAENHTLKRGLYLVRENSSLRIASLISTILSWIDNEAPEFPIQEVCTSGRSSPRPRENPAAPNIQDEAFILNSPMFKDIMQPSGQRRNEKSSEMQSLESSGYASLSQPKRKEKPSMESSGYGSMPHPKPKEMPRMESNGHAAASQPQRKEMPRKEQKRYPPTPHPRRAEQQHENEGGVRATRRASVVNPMPNLNKPHGWVFQKQQKGSSSPRKPSPGDEPILHGYTWIKSGPQVGEPLATSTPAKPRDRYDTFSSLSSTESEEMTSFQPAKNQAGHQQLPSQDHSDAALDQGGKAKTNVGKPEKQTKKNQAQLEYTGPVTRSMTKERELQESSAGQLYWNSLAADPRVAVRVIGEIAFQLDRRILTYIFGGSDSTGRRKRFYGYTIINIPDMIEREKDAQLKELLDLRHKYVIHKLSPHGYHVDYHANFTVDMVNKYGLLPVPPEQKEDIKGALNYEEIENILHEIAPRKISRDISVILACLNSLAEEDENPLFLW